MDHHRTLSPRETRHDRSHIVAVTMSFPSSDFPSAHSAQQSQCSDPASMTWRLGMQTLSCEVMAHSRRTPSGSQHPISMKSVETIPHSLPGTSSPEHDAATARGDSSDQFGTDTPKPPESLPDPATVRSRRIVRRTETLWPGPPSQIEPRCQFAPFKCWSRKSMTPSSALLWTSSTSTLPSASVIGKMYPCSGWFQDTQLASLPLSISNS